MSEQEDYENASLQDLFLAALDKETAAGRAAFLDAVCGVDSDRRRRIEVLLANHRQDGFLEQPAIRAGAEADSASESMAEGLGRRIGRYKLLEQIGEGGCGVVYVAEQEEPVRRRVALKIIKLGMDTRSVIARFEAERQALAMMDHPNIAKVLDAGATETGRPYFVMELVRGIPITEFCEKNRLSVRQRLELFILVCQAVQHAHQKGIIHRDIKPSNILVTLHDGVAVPRVIDFGIAKATVDQRLTDKTIYTEFQQFIGTPAYMSPEQAELSGLDIDTRSDIYSLGVLLYEMLVGKTPFDVEDLLACGLDELRRTIREREPVRPSTRLRTMLEADQSTTAQHRGVEVPRLVHLLSGDLNWIAMKCLEKDRNRRYDTANGLAMDIQRYLNQEPVLARPPSAVYRIRKFVRRNKLVMTAGSAVVTALVLGILGSTWQAVRATRAEREQTRLRKDAETARADESRMRELAEAQAYAADMKAAQVALQQNNRAVAVDLLRRYLAKPGKADLRGLEWRYLWEASRGDELLSFPHPTRVQTAVLTHDGSHVATLDAEGTLRVWEPASARCIIETEPRGSAGVILGRRLDRTTDGRWLAVAGNNVVEIWDTTVWRPTRTLPGVTHPLRFSPDDRFLATCGTNGLWIWDVHTWAHRDLTNTLARVTDLAFSPDGERLVSTSGGDSWGFHIQFWDTKSGTQIRRARIDGRAVLDISPDGHWLASGHWNGEVMLWDLETLEPVLRFQAHPVLYSLALSPDGTRLATGGSDQLIQLWETGTTNRLATFQGHENEIWSLDFSEDGRKFASASKDTTAKLWDVTENPARTQSFVLPPGCTPEGPLPDGSALVTLNSSERTTRLLSLPEGRPLRLLAWSQFEEMGCSQFWHLPANETIIGRTAASTFHFWSLRTGKHLNSVTLATTNAEPVSLSRDGQWLLVRSPENQLELNDLRTAQRVKRFKDYDSVVGHPAGSFSPDGSYLAYGTTNNAIKIWDLAANREKETLTGITWHVVPMQWSPDSRLVAGAGWASPVWLWSVESGEPLFPPLKGHQAGTKFAIFSSDGKTLITDSDDDITRWWSVPTGREVLRFRNKRRVWRRGHVAPAAVWDLGGRFLVWEEPRGVIQTMTLPTLAEIDTAESRGIEATVRR